MENDFLWFFLHSIFKRFSDVKVLFFLQIFKGYSLTVFSSMGTTVSSLTLYRLSKSALFFFSSDTKCYYSKKRSLLNNCNFFVTGTPINRLPIMAKSVLDLYELYNLVIARGGLVDVINKKLWQEIIKGLHLPSSITSAAFTLRTQ